MGALGDCFGLVHHHFSYPHGRNMLLICLKKGWWFFCFFWGGGLLFFQSHNSNHPSAFTLWSWLDHYFLVTLVISLSLFAFACFLYLLPCPIEPLALCGNKSEVFINKANWADFLCVSFRGNFSGH